MTDIASTRTITAITPQKKTPKRVNVYLDGEFWKGIDSEIVTFLGIKKGQLVGPDGLDKIIFEEDKKKAQDRALKLLEYRDRSVKEVEDRLYRAGFAGGVVAIVVEDLLGMGYLDDERFIQMWIKDRASKGYGQWRIIPELLEKGIERRVIEERIDDIYDESVRRERALEIGQKKLSTLTEKSKSKKYKGINEYLLRRGFSSETVTGVCQELLWQEEN